MFKYSPQLLKWSQIIQRNIYHCYIPHLMTTHHAELTIKATRRTFLSKAVLNQNKDVIHAEVRKPSDFILKLKQEGKCPAVIIPHSQKKQQEVDIVVGGKAMKTKLTSPRYGLERVFVRVEGTEYMCVLKQVQLHTHNFIQKAVFREYIPGKPNYLRVPILFTHIEENKFFMKGVEFTCEVQNVKIICYNEEYPTLFYVDVSYVNLDRPYTIGDLANTFPPGVILDPREDPNKTYFGFVVPEQGLTNNTNMQEVLDALNDETTSKAKAASATPAATTAAGGKAATTPAAGGKQAATATPAQGKQAGTAPAAGGKKGK